MRAETLILCVLLAACSASSTAVADQGEGDDQNASEDGNDASVEQSTAATTPPPTSGLSRLHLSPSREYSGFDGAHAFKVPIAVYGFAKGGEDTVTLAPDEAGSAVVTRVKLKGVDPVADSGVYFMVEPKKAGTLKLTAKAGTQTAAASISVATYDPARWEAGRARYENAGANGDPSCKSCHVNGKAIDNSPAALASVPDADVGRIMTMGAKPSRATIDTGCTDCSDTARKHQWELTDEERRGLITYLRGLEPRGFE